jgi:hypothetical protein
MIPENLAAALQIILAYLTETNITWALTGSASFALQGLPLIPNDIDLQTDQPGAHAIERCLQKFITLPVTFSSTGAIRSHFGELKVNSVKVEIIGDIEHRLTDGEWSPLPDLQQHIHWIEWETHKIPILSLDYEAQAYHKIGRPKRAVQLQEWLDSQIADGSNS